MTDAVTHWNDVLLQIVRAGGGPPGPISRGAAMMHGAIYDAVNSIAGTHEPYLIAVPAAAGASIEAAVAHAAHDALAAAFPSTTVDIAGELAGALSGLSPAAAVAAGKAVGRACAAAMIADHAEDGADDQTPHVTGNLKPGDWRPTGSGDAASPNWPRVKPFCMTTGAQFRPPRPGGYRSKTEMLASAEYAAQYNEVKALGEASSATRTSEQTEIAVFWANDLDGTSKPPGQLFTITRVVSEQRGLDVIENARLFALVALAMADAGICAWDAKYATDLDLWRPETAIQQAAGDGNPNTAADAAWEPLSRNGPVHFSPPFPAYVSGHATFAAAHAGIMRRYFGTDNVTFTATSEDPNLPAGVTRSFNSFSEAARENARSRVYLGVHFQWDGDHGYLSGTAVAEFVFATYLQARRAHERPSQIAA